MTKTYVLTHAVFKFGDQARMKRKASEMKRFIIMTPTSPRATPPSWAWHTCPFCGEPILYREASAHRREVHPLGR